MPFYEGTSAAQWYEEGLQKGLAEPFEEVERQISALVVFAQLTYRFGQLPESLVKKIDNCSSGQMSALENTVLEAVSLAEV